MNLFHDQFGHLYLFRRRCRSRNRQHGRFLRLDDVIHLGNVDIFTVAAQALRNPFVRLHDDDVGHFRNGFGVGVGGAEVEEAIAVHGGGLDKGYIGFRRKALRMRQGCS